MVEALGASWNFCAFDQKTCCHSVFNFCAVWLRLGRWNVVVCVWKGLKQVNVHHLFESESSFSCCYISLPATACCAVNGTLMWHTLEDQLLLHQPPPPHLSVNYFEQINLFKTISKKWNVRYTTTDDGKWYLSRWLLSCNSFVDQNLVPQPMRARRGRTIWVSYLGWEKRYQRLAVPQPH